ncbi:S-protein homolog 2 [Linum grandiflorum]
MVPSSGATIIMTIIIAGLAVCETATVYVSNNMTSSLILIVHCQSKDDDMKAMAVQPRAGIRWEFVPNFFNTTLFWCDLAVQDKRVSFVSFPPMGDNYRYITKWEVCDAGVYLKQTLYHPWS